MNPSDAERQIDSTPATPRADEVRLRVEAAAGSTTLSALTVDGRWVKLHSARDPLTEADRVIAPLFHDGEPPVIAVIGLGLGYILDAIGRRSSTTRVLALEPCAEAVEHMDARRDAQTWLREGRLRLLVGPDYGGASDAIAWLGATEHPVPVIAHAVLSREWPALVDGARAVVRYILDAAGSATLTTNASIENPMVAPELTGSLPQAQSAWYATATQAVSDEAPLRMRVLLGEPHRERILSFLKPGGRMLEWGCGGSTVWFADHLPPGASLVSVEHDPRWYGEIASRVDGMPGVSMLLRPASGPLGANATIAEEDARYLWPFVHAVDGQRFDVILVDGNARGACLARARDLLAPGGVVFLHDAQRAWYDDGKRLFVEYGHLGSSPDYPVPQLWWGGLATEPPTTATHATPPLIVSFYTVDTDYEIDARRLQASCDALQLETRIVGVPSTGSWERNCAMKASFIRDMWRETCRSVVWVDCDAVIHERPVLFDRTTADFAVHKWMRHEIASGTLFFAHTPLALRLLNRWVERCEHAPDVWDQSHLDLAWEELTSTHPLETLWLPRHYCQIFDGPRDANAVAVIEHFQASRRIKASRPPELRAKEPWLTPHLRLAREASRPRPLLLSRVDAAVEPATPLFGRLTDPLALAYPTVALDGLVRAAARAVGPGRVLSLASGLGQSWRAMLESGVDPHAVEADPHIFGLATRFAGDRVAKAESSVLPCDDHVFDAAIGCGLLDYLPEERVRDVLREVRRVTKGPLVLIVRPQPDPDARWHTPGRTRAWWTAALEHVGFFAHPSSDTDEPGWLILFAAADALTAEAAHRRWTTVRSRPAAQPHAARMLSALRERVDAIVADQRRPVVCWGRGEIADALVAALGSRVAWCIDPEGRARCAESTPPVRDASSLAGITDVTVLLTVEPESVARGQLEAVAHPDIARAAVAARPLWEAAQLDAAVDW